MVVPVPLSKLRHAMMVHAQHGLIGPAGMIAVPLVMVELSQEAENVKMERKMIARGQPQMNNNAIDNHVMLFQQWFTGMIQMGMLMTGTGLTMNIFPWAKPYWTNVWHIVCHIQAASSFRSRHHMTPITTSIIQNGKDVSSVLHHEALNLHI